MNPAESLQLVRKLSENSMQGTISDDEMNEVVQYADGIPLVIEQIVHNAILSGKTLKEILELVRQKRDLLKQSNRSSLHEDNLAFGGVLLQTFETLRLISDKAEALFSILAYFDPSAIPLSAVEGGGLQLHNFLSRSFTYNKGNFVNASRKLQEAFDSSEAPQESNKNTLKSSHGRWWKSFRIRSSSDLPIDDEERNASLLQACGPNTAIGRLFDNRIMIGEAITILEHAAIIRRPNSETLWMHDLVSEVAKALLEDKSATLNENMSLAAATMVYIAFPLPEYSAYSVRRDMCSLLLPHAIACHENLKSAGILNDCCIGPELSHIIGSTVHAYGGGDILETKDVFHLTPEEETELANLILGYYHQAFEGYMAGWHRLKHTFGCSDKQIYRSTLADYDRTFNFRYFSYNYWRDLERHGRSAPWRAIQTAVKLSYHYQHSFKKDLTQAAHFMKLAVEFYNAALGPTHNETLETKERLMQILQDSGDWKAAYDYGIRTLREIVADILAKVPSKPLVKRRQNPHSFDPDLLCTDMWASSVSNRIGESCHEMAQSHQRSSEANAQIASAREAVFWRNIGLRHLEWLYGEGAFECFTSAIWIAAPAELAGDYATSLRYYAKAVDYSMNRVSLGEERTTGVDPESIRETITTFRNAKERMVDKLPGDNDDLLQFLETVGDRIVVWEELHPPEPPSAMSDDDGPEDYSAIMETIKEFGLDKPGVLRPRPL